MINWTKFPKTILDDSDQYMYKWFPDGEMNICYNAIDRHLAVGDGENIALSYFCAYTDEKRQYTFNDLHENVGKLATMLKEKFGIKCGDRVLIYMPMIPEAAFSMLACARIGAIHSVVFGGFAAKELVNRIEDSKSKLIITCSAGIEPKKVIKYSPIIDEALASVQD